MLACEVTSDSANEGTAELAFNKGPCAAETVEVDSDDTIEACRSSEAFMAAVSRGYSMDVEVEFSCCTVEVAWAVVVEGDASVHSVGDCEPYSVSAVPSGNVCPADSADWSWV